MTRDGILDFYLQPGPMTSAGERAAVFDALPATVEDLAAVVQGIIPHEHWAPEPAIQQGSPALHASTRS